MLRQCRDEEKERKAHLESELSDLAEAKDADGRLQEQSGEFCLMSRRVRNTYLRQSLSTKQQRVPGHIRPLAVNDSTKALQTRSISVPFSGREG